MNITRTAMARNLLNGLLENYAAHPSFEPLANLQVQFNNMAAVIVFFAWAKVHILSTHFNVAPKDLLTALWSQIVYFSLPPAV